MRHIMVLNAKGGCGKSTLATNIAGFYADEGKTVALADYDPQGSSLSWLEARPDHLPAIEAIEGFSTGLKGVSRGTDVVVLDAPARSHGKELTDLLNHAETVLVPVLPSTIDMQATSRFLKEIYASGRYKRKQVKVGLIGNRVRENTLIFDELNEFLSKQRSTYVASLREAQNYVRAYTRGFSIFDLPEYLAWPDWEQWDPVVEWLDSKRSRP